MFEETPLNMLKKDHRLVENLFTDFKNTPFSDYDQRKEITEKVSRELEIHAKLEEETFYPKVEKVSAEGKALIEESRRDHQEIRNVIRQLQMFSPQDDLYEKKFQELIHHVSHHILEEENKVFPFAEFSLQDELGATLAAKMIATKEKIRAQKILEL